MKRPVALIIAALLGLLIGFGLYLGSWLLRHSQTPPLPEPTEEAEPTPTPTPEPTPTPIPYVSPIEFDALWAINPDVYAWLEIPGTTVSYPVLQHPWEDEYYLNRNLDGSEGLPGCVFSFSGMARDFSRFNTVLYAHNMADGSMFGALRNYADEDFFMAHRDLVLYTPQAEYHYRIFASTVFGDVLITAAYDETVMEDRIDYLQRIINSDAPGTVVPGDTQIALEDHILTLSTCVDEMPENRRLVLAILTEIIDEGRPETP